MGKANILLLRSLGTAESAFLSGVEGGGEAGIEFDVSKLGSCSPTPRERGGDHLCGLLKPSPTPPPKLSDYYLK